MYASVGPSPRLMRVGAEYCVTSRDLGVFVKQAAEPISSGDPDLGINGIG